MSTEQSAEDAAWEAKEKARLVEVRDNYLAKLNERAFKSDIDMATVERLQSLLSLASLILNPPWLSPTKTRAGVDTTVAAADLLLRISRGL